MRVDAVVFDLDDTLIDWTASIRRCVTDIAGDDIADRLLAWAAEHTWIRREGVVVHRNTWKLHEFADDCWPRALPELGGDDVALLVKLFRDELWVGFFPDTVTTLDVLVDQIRLAVLSNNPYAPREAARLRLHDWFEVTLAAPHPNVKPHADAFHHVCAALGTEPARTAYVGDSVLADVEGALAAGLVPVWLDRHGDGWALPAGVHRIAALADLPSLLGLATSHTILTERQ